MTETLGPAPDVKLADVKWRVDSTPSNGRARFIPYIDAYIASSLLDEWVGVENWKDDYSPAPHGKGLMCHLSIRHPETGEWVTKTDVGVASNTEPEKGTVSDAFKRAASLKWGVARNVYRLPNVWATVTVKKDKNNKDVAYPNDQTEGDIIRQLKAKGFTDVAETAGVSEQEPEVEYASHGVHEEIRGWISGLPQEERVSLGEWWTAEGLPSLRGGDHLTDEQAHLVLAELERRQQVAA